MIAIVYWSGTGNTEQMAELVKEGVEAKGGEAKLLTADYFSARELDKYSAFAFGCPAMGDEVLEEYDFQPMWDDVKDKLGDKKVVLFGSYSWNEGEWMEKWTAEAKELGLNLAAPSLAVYDAPEGDDQEKCRALGAALV